MVTLKTMKQFNLWNCIFNFTSLVAAFESLLLDNCLKYDKMQQPIYDIFGVTWNHHPMQKENIAFW